MSTTTRISGRKDVRAEAKVLQRLGFTYQGFTGRTHTRWQHPTLGTITLPDTPKPGGGWRMQLRREIARRMGKTLAELEAVIAGQPTVGSRTNHSRRPENGRRQSSPRALKIAPRLAEPSAAAGSPSPPSGGGGRLSEPRWNAHDPITAERVAHWQRKRDELERANAQERFGRKAA